MPNIEKIMIYGTLSKIVFSNTGYQPEVLFSEFLREESGTLSRNTLRLDCFK